MAIVHAADRAISSLLHAGKGNLPLLIVNPARRRRPRHMRLFCRQSGPARRSQMTIATAWRLHDFLCSTEEHVMKSQEPSRVVGIFDGAEQAEKAVASLIAAGIPTERIVIRARDWTGDRTRGPRVELQQAASTGAIRGAIIGAILGAVGGLLAAQIPGLEVGVIWLVALGAALGGAI